MVNFFTETVVKKVSLIGILKKIKTVVFLKVLLKDKTNHLRLISR